MTPSTRGLLLLATVILPVVAAGDTITLKNNATYVGRIVSEDAKSVTISADGAQWTFTRDRITSIKKDAAEAERADQNQKQHATEIQKHPRQHHAAADKTDKDWSAHQHHHAGHHHGAESKGAESKASEPDAPPSEADKMQRLQQLTRLPSSLSQ